MAPTALIASYLSTFPLHPSTPSGLPQLPSTHTLILTLPDSEIRFVPPPPAPASTKQIRIPLKTLWLTSRSLVFLPEGQQNLKHIPLSNIKPQTIETYTSFLGRNPKVKFQVAPMQVRDTKSKTIFNKISTFQQSASLCPHFPHELKRHTPSPIPLRKRPSPFPS